MIGFHVPYIAPSSEDAVSRQIFSGQVSGQGRATHGVHAWLRGMGYTSPLLTTSGSAALAMCAQLCELSSGDEVILPSYTHPSSASAFLIHGAVVQYADLSPTYPNISLASIESLITDRTRAIVVVHYGGVAVDLDHLRSIIAGRDIILIEDAAHGIGATYPGSNKPLGSLGDMGILSFHQTKNIHCGDGGMISTNRADWVDKAYQIWEKGTNRTAYMQGKVTQYEWMSVGSCYYPNELTAAFLLPQLQDVQAVNDHRRQLWRAYHERLTPLAEQGKLSLPEVADVDAANAHVYFIKLRDEKQRSAIRQYLASYDIDARTHYIPLHKSRFGSRFLSDGHSMPYTEDWADTLLRLPLHTSLNIRHIDAVTERINQILS